MAAAFHFFNDYDTRYEVYEGVRRTYDGPLTMATDLLVWNVTKDEIRVREAIVDDAVWPAPHRPRPTSPIRQRRSSSPSSSRAGASMSAKCSTRWSTASRRSTGSTEPCGSVVPRAGQRLAGPVAQEGASWVSSMARSRSATSSRPTRRRPTSRSSTRSRFTAPRPIASFPIASLPTASAPTAPAPIAMAPSAAARSAVTSVFRLACRRAQTRQPQRRPCPLLRAALIGPRPKRPRAPLLWRPGRDLQPP